MPPARLVLARAQPRWPGRLRQREVQTAGRHAHSVGEGAFLVSVLERPHRLLVPLHLDGGALLGLSLLYLELLLEWDDQPGEVCDVSRIVVGKP